MRHGPRYVTLIALALLVPAGLQSRARAQGFTQNNLVSDVPGNAPNIDPNLKNAWGVSFPPGGPFWVSNAGTSTATLYSATGAPNPLVVAIPTTATGLQGPTGQVFNGTTSFGLSDGAAATFIFADLNGHLYGWNGAAGTTALLAATGTAGASYDGLASGVSAAGNTLYATNNANTSGGGIDVFNSSFALTTLAGNFVDPNLSAGFHPYNIQNLGGTLYVTYNSAAGGGVVATFDQNGNFLSQITANGAAGPLSAPWGVAIAPTGFGTLGGDLLIGNRGNGMIDIFSPGGTFLGTLNGTNGSPLTNVGLWDLTFDPTAPGLPAGSPPTLFIAAGTDGYGQGLFAAITPVPEPSSMALCGVGAVGLGAWVRRRRK